jgi:hypothetical protein
MTPLYIICATAHAVLHNDKVFTPLATPAHPPPQTGLQGGPHNHTISGLACALKQAATPTTPTHPALPHPPPPSAKPHKTNIHLHSLTTVLMLCPPYLPPPPKQGCRVAPTTTPSVVWPVPSSRQPPLSSSSTSSRSWPTAQHWRTDWRSAATPSCQVGGGLVAWVCRLQLWFGGGKCRSTRMWCSEAGVLTYFVRLFCAYVLSRCQHSDMHLAPAACCHTCHTHTQVALTTTLCWLTCALRASTAAKQSACWSWHTSQVRGLYMLVTHRGAARSTAARSTACASYSATASIRVLVGVTA